jgi:hypothetical protein
MKPFTSSSSSVSAAARVGSFLLVLALPLFGAGCSDTACFQWSEAEGACPAEEDALAFFQDVNCPDLSEINSVEGEGYFEEDACCYPVTRRDDEDFFGGCFGGVPSPVGVSVVAVGVSGVGGAGGVMTASGAGGISGAGGAGGAGGSEICTHCSEALFEGGSGEFCEGSLALFTDFTDCMCKTLCADACASECSMGSLPSSMVCNQCVNDTMSGCGVAFNACQTDF